MTEIESTSKRRRWWLIILGSAMVLIVLLVGGVVAVGSTLGEDYSSTVSMSFTQSPDDVWAAIADYELNPVSATMRRETVSLPDKNDAPAWTEDIGSSIITVHTVESEKPARLVRFFEDGVVPMTSRVEYLLEADGDGTNVTMNGQTTIKDGTWHVPIFRVILSLTPDAGSLAYLAELRAHLNADANKESSTNDVS